MLGICERIVFGVLARGLCLGYWPDNVGKTISPSKHARPFGAFHFSQTFDGSCCLMRSLSQIMDLGMVAHF